ncbi:hypothetical protein BCR37DRAFT_376540 [Protomyces lactucae-debilis]|uniref:Uncharacterized protein n=1 Tax=Protomyces lactucae-debilis TaxID=2754530 RepID=A0A1Y2FU95_PROLT|nr:uncharacterized protein BCR37DRAFT_376540 [Protomyces lactucae-debilis]ORY87137.1 hypothetical protein BCR37DRAFT_376540 [Protomyces lactucae-debilis]
MPTIAVDFDDTLALTNDKICHWHNETYGTDLSIEEYYHFQYWRVRGWGDKTITQNKVKEFNQSSAVQAIKPIREAAEGLRALKEAGHRLVVVTARMASQAEYTCRWLERTYPGLFAEIIFTSAFVSRDAHAGSHNAEDEQDRKEVGMSSKDEHTKEPTSTPLTFRSIPRPKSEVCKLIDAHLLIDDSIENAYEVYANAKIPVALYGDWQWNKREPDAEAAASPLSWEQRRALGLKDDEAPLANLPDGVHRALTWKDVVEISQKVVK